MGRAHLSRISGDAVRYLARTWMETGEGGEGSGVLALPHLGWPTRGERVSARKRFCVCVRCSSGYLGVRRGADDVVGIQPAGRAAHAWGPSCGDEQRRTSAWYRRQTVRSAVRVQGCTGALFMLAMMQHARHAGGRLLGGQTARRRDALTRRVARWSGRCVTFGCASVADQEFPWQLGRFARFGGSQRAALVVSVDC
jgi:hypothetical protein